MLIPNNPSLLCSSQMCKVDLLAVLYFSLLAVLVFTGHKMNQARMEESARRYSEEAAAVDESFRKMHDAQDLLRQAMDKSARRLEEAWRDAQLAEEARSKEQLETSEMTLTELEKRHAGVKERAGLGIAEADEQIRKCQETKQRLEQELTASERRLGEARFIAHLEGLCNSILEHRGPYQLLLTYWRSKDLQSEREGCIALVQTGARQCGDDVDCKYRLETSVRNFVLSALE